MMMMRAVPKISILLSRGARRGTHRRERMNGSKKGGTVAGRSFASGG